MNSKSTVDLSCTGDSSEHAEGAKTYQYTIGVHDEDSAHSVVFLGWNKFSKEKLRVLAENVISEALVDMCRKAWEKHKAKGGKGGVEFEAKDAFRHPGEGQRSPVEVVLRMRGYKIVPSDEVLSVRSFNSKLGTRPHTAKNDEYALAAQIETRLLHTLKEEKIPVKEPEEEKDPDGAALAAVVQALVAKPIKERKVKKNVQKETGDKVQEGAV